MPAVLRLFALTLLLPAISSPAQDGVLIPPDDPRIGYSDYVRLEQAADPASPTGKTARFDRFLDNPGKGYRWDNPGARIRFRTDAATVEAVLFYSERHTSTSARNPIGRYWIDGKTDPAWTFRTRAAAVTRMPETVQLALSSPVPGRFHDYELVLPYGDSVEFQGLRLPPKARLETPPNRPAIRYVAYGDSITQGFTASEESLTYPFLLAGQKGWQLVNAAIAGRASVASDGAVVASLAPGVVTILMGTNDWQGGVPIGSYRARMDGFLAGLRAAQPKVPVYLITPLWVPPSWKPENVVADLEQYRQALRDLVAGHGDDANLHLIEGPTLTDPDPALFDRIAVHPNDQGFAQMADRLATAVNASDGSPEVSTSLK